MRNKTAHFTKAYFIEAIIDNPARRLTDGGSRGRIVLSYGWSSGSTGFLIQTGQDAAASSLANGIVEIFIY
jgi:hypothetical protein